MYVMCHQNWARVLPPYPTRARRNVALADDDCDLPPPPRVDSADDRALRLRIQQARLRRRQTQAELAQQMNLKESVVAAFEAGKEIPTSKQLLRLEQLLGGRLRQ